MRLNIQLFASNVSGWITIGFKGDISQLRKDRDKAQRELEKWERENEKLQSQKMQIEAEVKINKEQAQKEYEDAKKAIDEKVAQTKADLAPENWHYTDEQYADVYKDLEKEKMQALEAEDAKLADINQKVDEHASKEAGLVERVNETANAYDNAKDKADFSDKLNVVGKKMTGLVKSVGKWALALIGIRSIYALLSNAATQLEKTNKQTKADLDYMKFALGVALEPVITGIVNLGMKLLGVVGSIVQSISGINIFANASANAFKKANKSAGATAKTLAKFDEMSKVSSNGSSTQTPSMDLSNLSYGIDDVAQKIKEKWLNMINFLENTDWQQLGRNVYDKIKAWIESIDWAGLSSSIFEGIGAIFGSIGGFIVGILERAWEDIKSYFTEWIEKSRDEGLKGGWAIIDGVLAGILNGIAQIGIWIYDNILVPFVNGFKKAFGIASPSKVMKEMGTFIIEGFKEGISNIWENVKSIFTNLKDRIGETFTNIITDIKNVFSISNIKSHFELVVTTIKNAFKNIPDWFSTTFTNAWTKVKNVFSTGGKIFDGIKEGIADSFKTIVNGIIGGINKVISTPFNGINNALKKIRDAEILGITPFKNKISTISVPQIPLLAKGGVINLPNKGVAIGGEAGREGVIPLTDAQQMELLGEAIGRYITINLTNNTNLDGRTISRTTQQIKQNRDFAMNR